MLGIGQRTESRVPGEFLCPQPQWTRVIHAGVTELTRPSPAPIIELPGAMPHHPVIAHGPQGPPTTIRGRTTGGAPMASSTAPMPILAEAAATKRT